MPDLPKTLTVRENDDFALFFCANHIVLEVGIKKQ